MIEAGRVAVNGDVITSPALNVTETDKISVDGAPLPDIGRPRVWLYHKPTGLVTTTSDEKGRDTVFAALPPELGRVMSVGRLDMNSEGLLLLTNDGGLKRKLELPATGWLRKYRVRLKGAPVDSDFTALRQGIETEGERFQPMEITLDRVQGANAWITVGLREGKNREIRRALSAIGLTVNRLIRVSYGPFRLGELKPGEVEEIRPRVLRDQLGIEAATEGHAEPKPQVKRKRKPMGKAKQDPWAEDEARERERDGPGAKRGPQGTAARGPKGAPRKADAPRGAKAGTPARPTSGEKPAARPSAKANPKPALQPSAKPAAKPSEKPSARPAEKPSAKPATKPATKPSAKPATPDKPRPSSGGRPPPRAPRRG